VGERLEGVLGDGFYAPELERRQRGEKLTVRATVAFYGWGKTREERGVPLVAPHGG
jgi:hypothetical protein